MTIPILTAILSDPVLIWSGLFLFTVSITTIPVVFVKLNDVVTLIINCTLYLYIQLKDFFIPSGKSLENVEEKIKKASSQEEDTTVPEIANETMIDKILNIISMFIFKWKWPIFLARDWKLSGDPGYVIRYKLKSLFFLFATIGAALVCFAPAFMSSLGVGFVTAQLINFGVKATLANYTAVVFTGGLIYSLRTTGVALLLAIKWLYSRCTKPSEYIQASASPSSSETKREKSTHRYLMQLTLDASLHNVRPAIQKEVTVASNEPPSSIPIHCDHCQHNIYIFPNITLYSSKNNNSAPERSESRIKEPEHSAHAAALD